MPCYQILFASCPDSERGRPGDAEVRFMFGDYVLDQERRELTRRGQVVSVGPQVFDLLLHLVGTRDRVVSKDELLQAVWGGRIVSNRRSPATSMRFAKPSATPAGSSA